MQSWWRIAIVATAVGSIAAAIAIPGLMSSQRASNERKASTLLKTFSSAEADFRANDRDANEVNDFWTGDVTGLYSLKVRGQELRLIERSGAEADTCPIDPLCWPYRPRSGYFSQVLEADDSLEGNDRSYFKDTGGNRRMGDVHHESRFGFCAYPRSPGDGKYSFIINENNTIFRMKSAGRVTRWPSDTSLKSLWSG